MDLKSIYKQKAKQDYYSILEIEKSAKKSEFRKARRKLLSKYHPDKFEGENKKVCEKISALINDAFEALSDEKFREEYDQSGYKLQYVISNEPVVRKKKTQRQTSTTRGMSLTAIARVNANVLKEGGTIEVTHFPIKGKDLGNPKRTINVKPNTKQDSYHVYEGLGEQLTEGESGDLIVLFQCNTRLNENEKLRISQTPDVILYNTGDNLSVGSHELNVDTLLENPIKVKKEIETESLLFIREVDSLDKSLLIKY